MREEIGDQRQLRMVRLAREHQQAAARQQSGDPLQGRPDGFHVEQNLVQARHDDHVRAGPNGRERRRVERIVLGEPDQTRESALGGQRLAEPKGVGVGIAAFDL
jgi:hypothetical protein